MEEKNPAAVELGRLGGKQTSEAKTNFAKLLAIAKKVFEPKLNW